MFLRMLQRLGKALMYPIAILPFAAVLNRFGQLGIQYTGATTFWHYFWVFIQAPGITVFNNIGLVFCIGIAFGLCKDFRGEAALCGGVAYLVLTYMTSETAGLSNFLYGNVFEWTKSELEGQGFTGDALDKAWTVMHGKSMLFYVYSPPGPGVPNGSATYVLDTGVFGGIVLGTLTAWAYNRTRNIQLPASLSFFGGRRFLPMVVLAMMLPLGILFLVIWPWLQYVLLRVGTWIGKGAQGANGVGNIKVGIAAFVYGVVNRFAQPFGLHHIINTFLWFQLPIDGHLLVNDPASGKSAGDAIVVFGDINAFNRGVQGSGVFQTGYFPLFLGGLPGAACAMIFAAKNKNRKKVIAFLGGVAAVAFLTGIDEPLAFAFIFVSPLLWVIHAFFTGILCCVTVMTGVRLGFGFSAGLIDYLISFPMSWNMANPHVPGLTGPGWIGNPLIILPLSIIAFWMYFPTFLFLIKKMNIPTPGRTDEEVGAHLSTDGTMSIGKVGSVATKKSEKYNILATTIVKEVGIDNIDIVENCATRLRLVVKDNSNINDAVIKAAGAYQIKRLGKNGYQIIIGTDVENVTDRVQEIIKEKKESKK